MEWIRAAGADIPLLSDDEGIDAPGIRALIEAPQPIAEVVVAAPAGEQSGKGHGLQLHDPIFVTERKQPQGQSWYAIEGPPCPLPPPCSGVSSAAPP